MINNLKDPAFQKVLAEETDSRYYIDESKKPSSSDVPVASFRKLNVDWCLDSDLMMDVD